MLHLFVREDGSSLDEETVTNLIKSELRKSENWFYDCHELTDAIFERITNLGFQCSDFDEEYPTAYLINPITKILNKLQRARPTPYLFDNSFYSSGRARISLTHLFQEVNYTPLNSNPEIETLSFQENRENGFCLDLEPGEYENCYLPVITYRNDLSTGFYSDLKVDPQKAKFLYYYWEPESPYLLYVRRVHLFRNKIQAYYALFVDNYKSYPRPNLINDREIRAELLDKANLTIKEFLHLLEEPERELNNEYTTWLRNEKAPLFEGGTLDIYDEEIGRLALNLGYDAILLTHQPGSSGRLVSEVLDLRTRVESIRNLHLKS